MKEIERNEKIKNVKMRNLSQNPKINQLQRLIINYSTTTFK